MSPDHFTLWESIRSFLLTWDWAIVLAIAVVVWIYFSTRWVLRLPVDKSFEPTTEDKRKPKMS
jgi:hypothetical protein